jgi:hypothetical protein
LNSVAGSESRFQRSRFSDYQPWGEALGSK